MLEALLVSTSIVALPEMGDKTQLHSFVLAAKLKHKGPIALAILVATLANQFLAGWVGAWLATLVSPTTLRYVIAASFVAFGLWALKLATVALAARYESLVAVVTGATLGMMIANVPAVWMGEAFAHRVNMRWMRWVAAVLFILLGRLTLLAGDDAVRLSRAQASPAGKTRK